MKNRFWRGVLVGATGVILLGLLGAAVMMYGMGRCPICGASALRG